MSANDSCIRTNADADQIANCKTVVSEVDHNIAQLSKTLSLAGNAVRLKILYLLDREGELCPCDLADILEMSVPAVSQHIRKMKDSDMVTARRDGQTLYYSIVKTKYGILGGIFSLIADDAKIAV